MQQYSLQHSLPQHSLEQNSLDQATARQIVQRTMSIIKHSVNVMDNQGIIIASGDPSRIHQRHEGAVLALTENRVVEIDSATAKKLKGVKPGINLPIFSHNHIVGVIGVSGDPEQVYAYAALVKMAAELILEQVAMVTDNQWGKRYREELANQFIAEDYDQATIESMAAYLNLDLSLPRVVLILQLDATDPEYLKQLFEFFADNEPDYFVTMTHFSELILLKPISLKTGHWDLKQERKQLQSLLTRLPHSQLQSYAVKRVVIGGYFMGEQGLRDSYLSARATLDMAIQHKSQPKYLFYTEQSLPVLLSMQDNGWQNRELTKAWRYLVDNDRKGVLQQTLKIYFAQNCDLTQTANQLHIHVNTLRYRLQRVEVITGRKINNLNNIVSLFIGMNLCP